MGIGGSVGMHPDATSSLAITPPHSAWIGYANRPYLIVRLNCKAAG